VNWPSDIERRLWNYLSPRKQAKVLHDLDDEPPAPNECPNCQDVIGDHDSFCGEKCKAEFMGEDSATDDPSKSGRGMGL
jgi:hypothetical protein